MGLSPFGLIAIALSGATFSRCRNVLAASCLAMAGVCCGSAMRRSVYCRAAGLSFASGRPQGGEMVSRMTPTDAAAAESGRGVVILGHRDAAISLSVIADRSAQVGGRLAGILLSIITDAVACRVYSISGPATIAR